MVVHLSTWGGIHPNIDQRTWTNNIDIFHFCRALKCLVNHTININYNILDIIIFYTISFHLFRRSDCLSPFISTILNIFYFIFISSHIDICLFKRKYVDWFAPRYRSVSDTHHRITITSIYRSIHSIILAGKPKLQWLCMCMCECMHKSQNHKMTWSYVAVKCLVCGLAAIVRSYYDIRM